MPIVGAHVSTAGGLHLAFDNAQKIKAECSQIFLSAPLQWRMIDYSEADVDHFLEKQTETKIGPNFVHGIYLINLATDNEDNLKKGIDWLIWSQKTCHKLGLMGTNFHLGSHKGQGFPAVQKKVEDALAIILKNTPEVDLILENSAGAAIGGKFTELGALIKSLQDPRLKVCVDTQHAFASGYDLRSKEGIEKALEGLDAEVGLDRVVMIHANDSKTELGSGVDRHENIGQGLIGKTGFKLLLNHPQLKHLPFVLEVPGIDGKSGPDKENIEILKSLVDK